jgi:transposase
VTDVRQSLPPQRGRPRRQDHEYKRNGTANVFCAFEPLANWRKLAVTDRRTKVDFAHFVKQLADGRYKDARKIVLVMDQLNTHKTASLYEAFEPAEARRIARKLEIHPTPRHGSWLNMAEIELSVLGRRLNQRVGDKASLAASCAAVERERNAARKGADWRFTAADARVKLKRLYPTIEVA